MEQTSSFHPLDYVAVIRRRKLWLIVPIVVSVLVGAALALLLPKEYVSSATLAVTSPSVSTNIVRGNSDLDRDERARALTQQLVSRTVLERVALDEGLVNGRAPEAAADYLRARVAVAPAPTTPITKGSRSGSDTFLISYRDNDPELVQRVTNRLAQVFVQENSKSREARAEGTSAFLASQLERSAQRLRDLEEQLRKAKESNIGRLPEQTPANLQMLSGLGQQLDSNAIALRGEQDRLSIIERQIQEMEQGAAQPVGSGAVYTPPGSSAAVIALEQKLADARMKYTEKHPEVQGLLEELRAAKALAAADRERPAEDRLGSLQMTAAYRQLTADRERAKLRIRDLQRNELRIKQQIASYQTRVETAPMIEQEMSSLNREYQLEKDQYGALTEKHRTAVLNEDLERKQGGEQFRVLYAAYLPRDPVSPNVLRLMLVALGLGIGLGVGLVVVREYLDRAVYDARTLEQQFDLPVLGEVPRLGQTA